MECPSHWPERHSLRWHRPSDWLATPAHPSIRVAGLPAPQHRPEPPPSPPPSAHPPARPARLLSWFARGPGRRAGPAPAPRARGSINTAALWARPEQGRGAVASQLWELGNLRRGARRPGCSRSSEGSDWGPQWAAFLPVLLIFLAFWSRPSVAQRDPLAKPGATLPSIVGRGIAGSADPARRARRLGERSRPQAGPGACLPPSLAPAGLLAQGAGRAR